MLQLGCSHRRMRDLRRRYINGVQTQTGCKCRVREALTSGPESTAAAGASAGAWDTVASAPAWSTRSHLDILAMAAPLHSSTSRHARAAPELTMAAEVLPFRRPVCYLHAARQPLASATWEGCLTEALHYRGEEIGQCFCISTMASKGFVHKDPFRPSCHL